MNKLISIIVPIYKVEKYLHRCIDSILRQTYKKLEIILVNDGSPDKCGDICDEYAQKDTRIRVIHKENGGLSDARNVAIDIALGDYISFIDSDDWIHEKYIEKLYELLIKSNSDISVCNFIKTSTENLCVDIKNEVIYEYSNVEALGQLMDKFYGQMVVAWGKLYDRHLFEEVRFPIGRIHEDEFTTYKLIYKAKKIVLTTAQLLYYWQREDSIMGTGFNINHRLDVLDAYEERAEFFKEIRLKEFSGKTYKSIFFMYLVIIRRMNEFNNLISKSEVMRRFKYLKYNLRKNKYKLKFKVYYEMYYLTPDVMEWIYKAYNKINKLISGKWFNI